MQKAIDLYFGDQGNGRNEWLVKNGGHTIKSLSKKFGVLDIVIRHFVYRKTKNPRNLSKEQQKEIMALYFGPQGQGSICPKATNVAQWTVKAVAKHLNVHERSVEHAVLGRDFPNLKRPKCAPPYRGGYRSKVISQA